MKSFLITLLLAGAVSITASAQEGRPGQDRQRERKTPEQRAQMQTSKMEQALHLTATQRKAVYDANLKAATKMEPLMDHMMQNREGAKAIQQERDASMRQVLSADQYQQYEQMKAEQKKRRMEMMGRRQGAGQDVPPAPDPQGNEPPAAR